MITELCVIGHASNLGGADTELDHQIYCWQNMGIKVHICHTGELSPRLLDMKLQDRGCIYHKSRDWPSLKGFHVISFCNGRFLENLEIIKIYAKTATFVNCMTWAFRKEIEFQRKGLIDFHLYQTDHGMDMIGSKLKNLGKPYRAIRVDPYFKRDDFPFIINRSNETFKFGRISRGDAQKFNVHQLDIYKKFYSKKPKDGIIMGWGPKTISKYPNQSIPNYIKTYPECGISQQDFYKHCDSVIMSTDTFENLPRVGMESISSGSVLVVDNRGGWKHLVNNGVTGFLCNDVNDFITKSTLLANNDNIRESMRHEAIKKLDVTWGMEAAMKSWDKVFTQVEKLK